MYSKSNVSKLAGLALAVIILAGCSVPTATPAVIVPTADVAATFAVLKTQAVQTVVADLTLNAPTITATVPTATATEIPPTETPAATNTPVPPTSVPTSTFVPWTLTPSATATSIYKCSISEATPKFADPIKVNTDFDGRWVVKNTSSKTWSAADTDIRYSSGTKFQTRGDAFDLKADVAAKGTFTMIVDMKAPSNPGTYNTTWVIVSGSQTVCALSLSVQVVK